MLVADPSGASAVLEAIGGTVEAVHPTEPWQVATNFLLHGHDESARRRQCTRYKALSQALTANRGRLDWTGAMALLRGASGATIRSTVYDLATRDVYVVTNSRFDRPLRIAHTDLTR